MRLKFATPWLVTLTLLVPTAASLAQPLPPPGAVGGAPLPSAAAVRERLGQESERMARLDQLRKSLQPYVARHRTDPQWLVSRLQMYWQGRHTQVFVKNSLYDHAEGQAPVPTVRFTGARDTATAYLTPKLEDVKPYMGENDKLWLQRREGAEPVWEWVDQSKSGRIIESINMRIAELARDAAFLYWIEGNEDAGRLAFDVLDTYLNGIYYRELPVDLRKGHDQNIVGLQAYEVIQEGIIVPLTEAYALLGRSIDTRGEGKRARFDAALKKWADVQLLNGVPWNNWNLIKARFVLQIASTLGDNAAYADRRGRQHYVKAVIDGHGPRQWGLQRLLDFGYDSQSAMWNESASYSLNVLDDFAECLDVLDRVFGIDLLARMPVLLRAAEALPQYMLPSGRKVGFGDSRYELFHTHGVERLLSLLERRGRAEDVQRLSRLLAAMQAAGARSAKDAARPVHAILAAAEVPRAKLDVPPQAFQTPTYYSANTSWLIQRNGYAAGADPLVVSLVGANGNHAHANGLAMELFAKGMSLAPESGRGSGYFQSDYADYYSQFPAHNTVVVDGISAYPPMKVAQPFTLLATYPKPGTPLAAAAPHITMGEVGFIEPASQADQRRLLATVRVSERQAYVVDVFRSRRRAGADKYHDYLLHGLGQQLQFMRAGQPLQTQRSDKLSFSDGDLTGYEYWFDRQSLMQDGPLQAGFYLAMPEGRLKLQLWLQGGREREFFAVKAPPSTAWPRGLLPGGLDQLPSPTLVIRQTGAAWERPFAVVMEASREGETVAVEAVNELAELRGPSGSVGLDIVLAGQRRHLVLSNGEPAAPLQAQGTRLEGRMGLVGTQAGQLEQLFLSDGRSLSAQGARIECVESRCAASLWRQDGRWFYAADGKVRLVLPRALGGSAGPVVLPASGPKHLFAKESSS
ncbi:heparinase II/III family protein [Roseateles sp.]|uniref:heparinase II/III domain-containing protein n=1 Tax=Roseateles sp. TaxID=1971397 RepID=UPI0039EB02FC